jgi:aspartyl aminopeptidase
MAKKSLEKIQKELTLKKESAWLNYSEKDKKDAFIFAEGYKTFLSKAKTERESVKEIELILKKNNFKEIKSYKNLKKGDKVYKIIKNRAIIAAIINNNEKLRIIGSHIDSPRLDLKPYPIYEDSGMAMLKTHYYGGIKKYQWVNTPLAMHGIINTKKGKIEISIGEKDDEPKFIIPDLLPHLAKEQMEKKLKEGIEGEDLHILIGNMPVSEKKLSDKVKLQVLIYLNEKYGIIEKDFISADIQFVPASKPIDIGFDKSLISAYGQDDHVCAYTSLIAFISAKKTKYTTIAYFTDKEEIGSVGNTGAQSLMLESFTKEIIKKTNINLNIYEIFENSWAISADVTDGLNPIFTNVHDSQNVNLISFGVSIEKYGGHGGKYSTNDSSSEYMTQIIKILEDNNIKWQTGELGKIDIGGGGTIGMFIARYGIDVIDMGPPILAMHSPCEVTSKTDIYETYKAYKSFYEN